MERRPEVPDVVPHQVLRIKGEGHGLGSRGITVFLDDTEITCVRRLELTLDTDEINSVTLEIAPDGLDIDAETLASLVAYVDLRRQKKI